MKNGSDKDWVKNMKTLYHRVFREAEFLNTSKIALPLFGTGVGAADPGLAVRVLVASILTYIPRSHISIIVVTKDGNRLDEIETQFIFQLHYPEENKGLFESMSIPKPKAVYNVEGIALKGHSGFATNEELGQVLELSAREAVQRGNAQHAQIIPRKGIGLLPDKFVERRDDFKKRYNESFLTSSKEDDDLQKAIELSKKEALASTVSTRTSTTTYQAPALGPDTSKKVDEVKCSICFSGISDQISGLMFSNSRVQHRPLQHKPLCPTCNMVYGEVRGNQPDGQMDVGFSGDHLPGYEGHGTITITYYFPCGYQKDSHPYPRMPYTGNMKRTYLPDSDQGNEVLELLRRAFDRRLLFTISHDSTTGVDTVTENGINLKTNQYGGPRSNGYPDSCYLSKLRRDLECLLHTRPEQSAKQEETHVPRSGNMNEEQNRLDNRGVPVSENIQGYNEELQGVRDMAIQKGFTMEEPGSGRELFTSLSQQLTHVMRVEMKPGQLRAVVARYLRNCQSNTDISLEMFLSGTSLEEVLATVEKGGYVESHIILSAVCNALNVEVLLLAASGQEMLFQPFGGKEFLPTLALGNIFENRFISLKHVGGHISMDKPLTWSRSSKETELVTLLAESEEFQEVQQSFFSTIGSSNRNVIQIQRVQSTTQWNLFTISRDKMTQRLPNMTCERLLWHGTSSESIRSICQEGFNRSFSGKNASCYGEGVYFSETSSYAARDIYSVPGLNAIKHMFRARVLTGQYTQGKLGMKVPPWFDVKVLIRYDSVVDNVDKPNCFVIFHDTKAYPEYLVKFT